MTLDTPDTSVILGIIAILCAGPNPPKVSQSAIAAAVYGEGYEANDIKALGVAQSRAVDRALQKARKAGLIASDTKLGWSLTATGRKALKP